MELTPYSLANNFVQVRFDGIDDPVSFQVDPAVAVQTVNALCHPTDEQGEDTDEPAFWIKVPLLDGSILLLGRDRIALLTHVFEVGIYEGVPPKGIYGSVVEEAVAEAHEWGPVMIALGITGVGVIDLYDQSTQSADTLADTVPEGYLFAPFVSFTDDDGETNVVATDRVAFVVLHPEVL